MKKNKKKRTQHHIKVPVKNDNHIVSQNFDFIKCEACYGS